MLPNIWSNGFQDKDSTISVGNKVVLAFIDVKYIRIPYVKPTY